MNLMKFDKSWYWRFLGGLSYDVFFYEKKTKKHCFFHLSTFRKISKIGAFSRGGPRTFRGGPRFPAAGPEIPGGQKRAFFAHFRENPEKAHFRPEYGFSVTLEVFSSCSFNNMTIRGGFPCFFRTFLFFEWGLVSPDFDPEKGGGASFFL
jgi:hypothetical protein